MSAYYNEHEPYAAEWLRNLIKAGHIADGEVDIRSIVEVAPDDLRGFTQCHFFAGIGGWSLAARLAGWPDDRPLWTGSCPCQPFSVAGKGAGQADERHLWPEYLRLISAIRPPVVMGEQVAAAVGKSWLDGVYVDLESIGYACGAVVVPACAVGAPHRRDRLWFVADAKSGGWGQRVEDARRVPERIGTQGEVGRSAQHGDVWPMANTRGERCSGSGQGSLQQQGGAEAVGASEGDVEHADVPGRSVRIERDARGGFDGAGAAVDRAAGAASGADSYGDVADAMRIGRQGPGPVGEPGDTEAGGDGQASDAVHAGAGFWHTAQWLTGADGKARRFEPGIRLLAHGVPARVGKLRAYGNAIVPQTGAEMIAAFMEMVP